MNIYLTHEELYCSDSDTSCMKMTTNIQRQTFKLVYLKPRLPNMGRLTWKPVF